MTEGWRVENGGRTIETPDGEVKVSTSHFADAVREAAKAKGYSTFKVFVGGEEIVDSDEAPATLPIDETVRVEPYNKAG